MATGMDERDLLALDTATTFALAPSGRILRMNVPDNGPGPRLYLAGCSSGNVVRIRYDVAERTARAIERLAAGEPILREAGSTPVHLDDYLQLLAAEAPVERCDPGLAWVLPKPLTYRHPALLVSSATAEGDRLLARLTEQGMPAALVDLGFVDVNEFWAPWCVALHRDEIASIAFAARLAPASAATGVATVPEFRGRGFAAAATAGWASHPALARRILFYGTSLANVSSRAVARRLGLRFLGPTLSIM